MNDIDPVVVVPADLDIEDRLAGPVTYRMAAWLAVGAAGIALAVFGRSAPVEVTGVVVAVAGAAGGTWRPGGRPVAAWLRPLASYRRRTSSDTPTDLGSAASDSDSSDVGAPSAAAALAEPSPRPRRLVPAVLAIVLVVGVGAASLVTVERRGRNAPLPPASVPPPASSTPVAPVLQPTSAPTSWVEPLPWWWWDCGC